MKHLKKTRRRLTKKYRCVRVNYRNKKLTRKNMYKRKGGGTIVPPGLPLVIDKSNIMYTCTPV